MLLSENQVELCVIATNMGVDAKDVGCSRRGKGWSGESKG
jgi:hypothetical protein